MYLFKLILSFILMKFYRSCLHRGRGFKSSGIELTTLNEVNRGLDNQGHLGQ